MVLPISDILNHENCRIEPRPWIPPWIFTAHISTCSSTFIMFKHISIDHVDSLCQQSNLRGMEVYDDRLGVVSNPHLEILLILNVYYMFIQSPCCGM